MWPMGLLQRFFRATGFVGNPVALAYVRAGHDVYGVTRSESKAKELQAEESTYTSKVRDMPQVLT